MKGCFLDMKNLKKAIELVSFISPSIRLPGRRAFTLAIHQAQKLLAVSSYEDVLVTKDVYPVVAKEILCSLETTERAIYRCVEACWFGGENDALNQIIGRTLPVKPKPSEMILYCAYYLTYDTPYHSAATNPALPMPF